MDSIFMENGFTFFTKEIEFQESSVRGALVLATVMELDKISGNGRVYRIEEAQKIAMTLDDVPVFYGSNWMGRHTKGEPVGYVESGFVEGNKIKAKIRITASNLIDKLKKGIKFLFSVGGNAIQETIKKIAGKTIHILHGAMVNHLQILDLGTPVGFPDAKIEKLIEINETVMICEGGLCYCKSEETGEKPQNIEETTPYSIINTEEIIEIDESLFEGADEIEIEIDEELKGDE